MNDEVRVRLGRVEDAAIAAAIHASAISEGFLPTLGAPFLRRLYRRIVRHPRSFLLVAEAVPQCRLDLGSRLDGGRPAVLGIGAGTEDVRALYRSFLLHDGLLAAVVGAPRLARSWRRVLETLRYPSTEAGEDLPPRAELLSAAVRDTARGRGVGRVLVRAILEEFEERGTPSVRVVAASNNASALGLYEASGFHRARQLALHQGTTSEVLVWP